jgi:hypothetical protein
VGGVYLGNNKVITKGDNGTIAEYSLDSLISGKAVVTALRHDGLDTEKGALIVGELNKLKVDPLKDQTVPWLKVSMPTVRAHADVCRDAGPDKKKCMAFNGKINLGTSSNDTFQFTDAMIGVFAKHQLPFVPLMSKEHNGSLRYFGHLKNKA